MVGVGDVVNVCVRGDNGEEKNRYCVVMERVPPGVPSFVLMMFCCARTKGGAKEGEYVRIDSDAAIARMNLDYESSFHLEDVVAAAAASPNLKKIGSCPRDEMTKLMRMYQIWKERRLMPKFSPQRQPPAVVKQVAKHLGVADPTKPS